MPASFRKLNLLLGMLLLAGCGNKAAGPGGVPKGAELVNSGKGNLAHFASSAGTVHVVDADSGKVIFTARMNAGDKLMIYPPRGQLALNGTAAAGVSVNPDHAHRIYFSRG